eukprot:7550730-Prorocentrum_lima.AAC.1
MTSSLVGSEMCIRDSFIGRPTRRQRFHYRRWSTIQKAAPPRMCAGCSTYFDIKAGREHGAACLRGKGKGRS